MIVYNIFAKGKKNKNRSPEINISGTYILEGANSHPSEIKTHPIGEICVQYYKPSQQFMADEATDPRGETTTAIFLNLYYFLQHSKNFCPYRHRSV